MLQYPEEGHSNERTGRHFLTLRGKNGKPLQPSYSKGGSWLTHFGQLVTFFFFFFLNHQFVTRCSIAVRGRLSTTSSLQFWPQETKTPLIGIETQLESIEFKEKSK